MIVLGNSHTFDGSELPVRYLIFFFVSACQNLCSHGNSIVCSQMLLKFGLVYSRLMSDIYKVCVFLTFCTFSIIDAILFLETGDDDATAAFGLLAMKHLVDALDDPKLDFDPKRVLCSIASSSIFPISVQIPKDLQRENLKNKFAAGLVGRSIFVMCSNSYLFHTLRSSCRNYV
jgi:hypothetical protein